MLASKILLKETDTRQISQFDDLIFKLWDRTVHKNIQLRLQVTPECHRELDAALRRGEHAVNGGGAPMQSSGPSKEDPRNLPPVVLMDED